MRRTCRLSVIGGCLLALTATSALAQGTGVAASIPSSQADAAPAARSSDASPRVWEVELHGGRYWAGGGQGGSGTLPSTGGVAQGLVSASTFYAGSGASAFNASQAGAGIAITPLDAVLLGAAVTRRSDAELGVRVQRTLTPHLAFEASAEYGFGAYAFRSSALTGIEASRASYLAALQRVLGRAPLASTVTSVSTITDAPSAPQVVVTGALVARWKEGSRFIPYVTAGAGAVMNNGTLPKASLTGAYQFGSDAQILGTDTVALHYTQRTASVVYLGGGGVKYLLMPRLGIRLDARVQAYRSPLTSLVDMTPGASIESTGAAYPVVDAGSLRFSATSPLTAGPVAGAVTFKGSGLEAHTVLTVGTFLRF